MFYHWLRLPLLCGLSLLACDYGLQPGPEPNPRPVLETVEPKLVTAGEDPNPVTLSGLGFIEGSQVLWNGSERPAALEGPGRLRVALTREDVSETGTGELVVLNPEPGGGASSSLVLTVGNPPPVLDSISPNAAEAVVTPGIALRVHGSRFTVGPEGAQVLWDGIPLSTTTLSSGELRADVSEYFLRRGDTVQVSVRNPAPAGGTSAPRSFTIQNPVPVVFGVDPSDVLVNTDIRLEVTGSGFVDGAEIWYGTERLSPDFLSGSRVVAAIPGRMNARGDTVRVRVENTPPGGGISEDVLVPVLEHPPRLEDDFPLLPRWVLAGADAFTISVRGEDFAPDATITWNGEARAAHFVDSTELQMFVEAADVTTEGTAQVVVTNPREGGSSRPAEFTILPTGSLPDGRIVWVRGTHSSGDIVISHLNGANASVLDLFGAQVDAAPGGGFVAVNQGGRIVVWEQAMAESRRLNSSDVEGVLRIESWPRFSSDGEWIYFQGQPYESDSTSDEIWRVRVDGSDAGRLQVGPSNLLVDGEYPAPSDGGGRLSYYSGSSLNVVDIGTGEQIDLAVQAPTSRWAPEDEWIAYRELFTHNIGLIRPDGSEARLLVSGGGFGPKLDWSPDGRFIVAVSATNELRVIEVATGEVFRLPEFGPVSDVAWYAP